MVVIAERAAITSSSPAFQVASMMALLHPAAPPRDFCVAALIIIDYT
jgi:hypothetical protein